MKLGAQVSAAGGVFNAFKRGDDVGADTVMVYTKSNRQWKAKPIDPAHVEKFHAQAEKYPNVTQFVVHAAYLINVASPKPELWEKSYQALKDEVERADLFGVDNMVLHPGSHMDATPEEGLERIAKALVRVIDETPDAKVHICLETMAGQGTNLGWKFEHLAYLLNAVNNPARMGVCFDTCHVFSAGYDIRTPEAYAATMAEFDSVVGLEWVRCFHLNDSKFDLGKKKDRHDHIGRGFIGEEGFANFVNDPRWADHPAHLETPKVDKDADGNVIQNDEGKDLEMDPVNLAVLRGMIQ